MKRSSQAQRSVLNTGRPPVSSSGGQRYRTRSASHQSSPIRPPISRVMASSASASASRARGEYSAHQPLPPSSYPRNQPRPPYQSPLTALQSLAARITAHTDALAAFTSIPTGASSSSLLPRNAPAGARAEQMALRDALTEAAIIATDAADLVPDLAVRNNLLGCLRWLCHFGVPEMLPLEEEEEEGEKVGRDILYRGLSYEDVSSKADVPVDQLRSIVRMAMLGGFLTERKGKEGDGGEEVLMLAHSRLSAGVVRQPDLVEWMRFVTSTSAPMVGAMVEATERWGRGVNNRGLGVDGAWGEDKNISKTAYAAAWKTDLPLFAHVAANPDLQARYVAYMRIMTHSEGMAVGHLIDGWREGWEDLTRRGGVLVDVGGSSGHASKAVAEAFPGIRVVVQDRPEVVGRAANAIACAKAAQLEEDNNGEGGEKWVAPVMAFQAHDFFTPQPERPRGFEDENGGVVYLLRQILHDWDDVRSVTILRHVAAAMKKAGPMARLVVMDTVLPLPGETSYSRTEEALLRVRDLTMMQAHNAHERNMQDWEKLVEKAHPKLNIMQVVRPFKSLMAVIEISLDSHSGRS